MNDTWYLTLPCSYILIPIHLIGWDHFSLLVTCVTQPTHFPTPPIIPPHLLSVLNPYQFPPSLPATCATNPTHFSGPSILPPHPFSHPIHSPTHPFSLSSTLTILSRPTPTKTSIFNPPHSFPHSTHFPFPFSYPFSSALFMQHAQPRWTR